MTSASTDSKRKTGDGRPATAAAGPLSAEELRKREIDVLPRSLAQAIDCLEQDDVVNGALGSDYANYYIQTKRGEWRRYHNSVSQWELDNYLGVY